MRLTPVAGIFLHGPHFGDRYGIAHTLVEALEKAHISLLALSCTISSISVIIRQHELAAAQVVLGQAFAAPVDCAWAPKSGRILLSGLFETHAGYQVTGQPDWIC